MQSRSIIELESQSIESQQLKSAVQARYGREGLYRVVSALRGHIKEKLCCLADTNTSRSKQKVFLSRQAETKAAFYREIENIMLSIEEAERMTGAYHVCRVLLNNHAVAFHENVERKLGTQKEKLLQRLIGFTKGLVDDLFEEKSGGPDNNKDVNAMVFKLQKLGEALVADSILPALDSVSDFVRYVSEPIVVLNVLELLELIANHNLTKATATHILHYCKLLDSLVYIIGVAFGMLRRWDKDREMTIMLLFQTFKTLEPLLNVMTALHHQHRNALMHMKNIANAAAIAPLKRADSSMTDINSFAAPSMSRQNTGMGGSSNNIDNKGGGGGGSRNRRSGRKSSGLPPLELPELPPLKAGEVFVFEWDWDDGRSGYSLDHLASDMILWLKVTRSVIHQTFDVESAITVFGMYSSFEYQEKTLDGCRNAYKNMVIDLGNYITLGTTMVKNQMTSADYLAHWLNARHVEKLKELKTTEMAAVPVTTAFSTATEKNSKAGAFTKSANKNAKSAAMTAFIATPPSARVPPSFGTLHHELLLSALSVGESVTFSFAARLGPVHSCVGLALDDTMFLNEIDTECAAALRCATTAFAIGLRESAAVNILNNGTELAVHRYSTFFLMSAYVKCAMAATSSAIELSDDSDSNALEIRAKRTVPYPDTGVKADAGTSASTLNILPPLRPKLQKKISFAVDFQPSGVAGGNMNSRAVANAAAAAVAAAIDGGSGLDTPDSMDSLKDVKTYDSSLASAVNSLHILPSLPFHYATTLEVITVLRPVLIRVMMVFIVHMNSLTLCHSCLLLLRLLMRDCIVSKTTVIDIVSIPLLGSLQPLMHGNTDLNEKDDIVGMMTKSVVRNVSSSANKSSSTFSRGAAESGGGGVPTTSGAVSSGVSAGASDAGETASLGAISFGNESDFDSRPTTAQSSAVNSVTSSPRCSEDGSSHQKSNSATVAAAAGGGGGGDRPGSAAPTTPGTPGGPEGFGDMKEFSPKAKVFNWKEKNLLIELYGSMVAMAPIKNETTFAGLLKIVSEYHIQSRVIVEQLLLLIHHIADKSLIHKYVLMDAEMHPAVQRILDSQIDDAYIIALCEVCLESLEHS